MTDLKVVDYFTDHGSVIGIVVSIGHKYTKIILMDAAGIRIRKVKNTESRYMRELDYPIAKAARRFRQAARRFGGLSKSVKQALAGV